MSVRRVPEGARGLLFREALLSRFWSLSRLRFSRGACYSIRRAAIIQSAIACWVLR
jgi:hypothetical protein